VSGYAIALLAAGASRRFGPDDKLLASRQSLAQHQFVQRFF